MITCSTHPSKGDGCSAEGEVHGGEPEASFGSGSNVRRCWIAQRRRAWNARRAILFAYVKILILEGSAISSNHSRVSLGFREARAPENHMSAGDPKFLLNSWSVG